MENNKWLYFAAQVDEVNNNGIDDSVCFPAKDLVSISPTANNTVTMYFESVKRNKLVHPDTIPMDSVSLTTIVGDAFEVANDLVRYINSYPHSDGFIVIADDTVTTDDYLLADETITGVYAHRSITAVDTITIGGATLNARFMDFGVGVAAPGDMAAGALVVNTQYQSIAAATAMTLPSAATGKAGDWINVYYNVAAGNGNAHTFTTHADDSMYAPGSTIRTSSGSGASRVPTSDVSVAGDNIITITGDTNGDGGVGTYVRFVNVSGAALGWAADVFVGTHGTGDQAATSVFS